MDSGRGTRLRVNGKRALLRVEEEHLVVDGERRPRRELPIGEVEPAPRDHRLLVMGVALYLVGGFLTGLLWSGGWVPHFVAAAVPWAGVALTVAGFVAASRARAVVQVGDLRIEGRAERVHALARALRTPPGLL